MDPFLHAAGALNVSVETLPLAYEACGRLCRAHYENFPVASWFVAPRERRAMAVIYAFARLADDFADEPGLSETERLAALSRWRAALKTCGRDHRRHFVFWALGDVVRDYGLPLDPFERLLTAFERDVLGPPPERFEDLLDYCRYSANPVGELVLRVHRVWTPRRGEWSDAICTGLQLANFWQDVSVDAARGRFYIPTENLTAMGLNAGDIKTGPVSEEMRELIAHLVDRSWEFFHRGKPLISEVGGRLGWNLRLVWLGGTRVLERIEKQRWDVWLKRPALGWKDALPLAARLLSRF